MEVWVVPPHGASPAAGPILVVLEDGTIYIRDLRAESPGLNPVWTGSLADPSLLEELVGKLPRGGDSTFGTSGGDAQTVIVVLDGEPVAALHNPRFVPNDPDQRAARDLAVKLIYEQLANPEWWISGTLLDEPLSQADLDTVVGLASDPRQRSSFDDDYQARPYVETPWPFGPPRFGCFFLRGADAEAFAEILGADDQKVLWTLDDGLAFLTGSERWLLPYEVPCEPQIPSLATRFAA